jgi:hypothetical protein
MKITPEHPDAEHLRVYRDGEEVERVIWWDTEEGVYARVFMIYEDAEPHFHAPGSVGFDVKVDAPSIVYARRGASRPADREAV